MVAATVRCALWGGRGRGGRSSGRELCASTQQASQAPLAGNRPEGQRLSPEPSLRSLMASSTVAWAAVVCVGGDGVEVVSVGDEAVVAPVGPQLALGAEQAAAAYDQAQLGVGAAELVAAAAGLDGGLSHLGLAAAGVFDRLPGVVVDGLRGCFDLGVLWDRDRVGRTVGADGRDHVIGEEPRVGAHRHRHVRRQAPHPRQRLTSEALVAALRRSRPHPRVQHLPVSERTATSG